VARNDGGTAVMLAAMGGHTVSLSPSLSLSICHFSLYLSLFLSAAATKAVSRGPAIGIKCDQD
jgi:hypothetical protein